MKEKIEKLISKLRDDELRSTNNVIFARGGIAALEDLLRDEEVGEVQPKVPKKAK